MLRLKIKCNGCLEQRSKTQVTSHDGGATLRLQDSSARHGRFKVCARSAASCVQRFASSSFGLPLMLVRRARSFLLCVIAMVFIGVGSTSLAYGQKFESVLQDYCIQKCAEFKLIEEHREWQQKYFPMDEFPHTVEPPVGCTCPKISPPGWGGVADHTAVPKPARTTLPTAVFLVAPPTLTCVLSPRCECCHGFTT